MVVGPELGAAESGRDRQHVVKRNARVPRDQHQSLRLRLGNQHPVERRHSALSAPQIHHLDIPPAHLYPATVVDL